MKLTAVHVTNFRSVEDSEEFQTPHTTCLVGKNEAGKTAILLALASLNPHSATPFTLNRERDYPRRFLTQYEDRHAGEPATVVRTVWDLESSEVKTIEAEFGQGVLAKTSVTVFRRYDTDSPTWGPTPIDVPKAIAHVIDQANLNAAEQAQLRSPSNSKGLRHILTALSSPSHKQYVHNIRWAYLSILR